MMDPRISNEVSITDLFDQFIEATTMGNVLSIFHRILNYSDLNPCEFNSFFPQLKRAVMTNRIRKNWKAKALFSRIDKKAAHRCYSNTKAPTPIGNRSGELNNSSQHNSKECLDESISSQSVQTSYNNNALQNYNCLVIGSGPAGLRTAIELQLLGASKVVVVEKRSRFSRNNVLHLWPFVIDDLKSLGAKKFYGKFCAGSIDHISIRQLQLILLKICLMIGCDFRDSCSYLYLCPTSIKKSQQVSDKNNSDISIVNSSCDNMEFMNQKCDLDVNETEVVSSFVKVSKSLEDDILTLPDDATSSETTNPEMITREKTLSLSDVHNPATILGLNQKLDVDENYISLKSTKEPVQRARTSLRTPTIIQPQKNRGENLCGARAHFQSDYHFQEKELHSYEWDVIIGADGRRNTLSKFFPRKEFRGRLAIAITANFINRQTPAEASVSEISGLSFIYNQDMFNALAYDTNIVLENICYYKDDTHYFVMTAKKKSLLERGVLIKDYPATQDLLSSSNVNNQALLKYAKDAAYWTTGLEPLDFALNHYGQEDCAMFDFTSMYAASNACKALRTTSGGLALVGLVGDSLLEPFWPTGSGCARGFLSSFDAAWMCRQWAVNRCAIIDHHNSISSRSSRTRSPNASQVTKLLKPSTYDKMALTVIAERESIYRILAQTTSENLQQNYSHWTLNPHTRYPNLNRHLVMPSQVEHLVTDNENKIIFPNKNKLATPNDRRRVKSPNNKDNLRKSPKKLKSADASPDSYPKYPRGKNKSPAFKVPKSKSRYEMSLNDTYQKFEESYNNLDDGRKGSIKYLSYRSQNPDVHDEFFDSSISGTLPSSNNLISLEARRARDIDECLKQRRQKKQLNVVRDQLMVKLRGESANRDNEPIGCGAALFNELRRLKEQQARGKENNKPRDINGSLTLLNSMRRCASFAERVKSFESKLSSSNHAESTPVTPRTPVDNIRNLPHFNTLQELFVCNSTLSTNTEPKKSKIPIMKLSKDDWNVKCWEKRLANHRQKSVKDLSGSTKSLNKSFQRENYSSQTNIEKPEKQVEVFKDRIKEMAEKLKKVRDTTQQMKKSNTITSGTDDNSLKTRDSCGTQPNAQSRGWVSHLRKELIKGVEAKRPQNVTKQAMNPIVPNKPIKKLFADDDDDEDNGIDVDKHYDHLCINKPTNKYLPKNGYTSHLVRSKYNSATSKVINRASPSTASKQAYLNLLTSRGSSASSTLSDYSTNTGGSSSGGGVVTGNAKGDPTVIHKSEIISCFRCSNTVDISDKISIEDSFLHRSCLGCSSCGITLRTNELQHYLDLQKDSDSLIDYNFVCAICKPTIRNDLKKEAQDRLALAETNWTSTNSGSDTVQHRMRSREDFLNEKINYNELYKNIMTDTNEARKKIDSIRERSTESVLIASSLNSRICGASQSQDSNDTKSTHQNDLKVSDPKEVVNVSPSPVRVTLPLRFVVNEQLKASNATNSAEVKRDTYRIAKSETVDGSEQVTLILPSSTPTLPERLSPDEDTCQKPLMDEEELQRILHIDIHSPSKNRQSSSQSELKNGLKLGEKSSTVSTYLLNKGSSNEDDSDVSDDNDEEPRNEELSDASSKLNSPISSTNSEDVDNIDNNDQNSTYDDFLTSEEFGAASDAEDEEDEISLTETDVVHNPVKKELQDVKVSEE